MVAVLQFNVLKNTAPKQASKWGAIKLTGGKKSVLFGVLRTEWETVKRIICLQPRDQLETKELQP